MCVARLNELLQMQLTMNSPPYTVGMARKFESTMTFYQKNIVDFVGY